MCKPWNRNLNHWEKSELETRGKIREKEQSTICEYPSLSVNRDVNV